MKILFLVYIYFVSIIFGFNKNALEEEIRDHVDQFLILKNTQKFCEGTQLLLAPNTENLFPLSKVLDICESKKECDYISFSPKRQLRNSIHYENEKVLIHTGANWICSGEKWIDARLRKYWISAIKGDNIRNQMESYHIKLNTSGECEEEDIVLRIKRFISPKVVAEECNRISHCNYIIFNYNRKVGKEDAEEDRAILCSKPPFARKNQLGYFIAGKPVEDKTLLSHKKLKKNTSLTISPGGSITPDEYYKTFEKGELVPSENI